MQRRKFIGLVTVAALSGLSPSGLRYLPSLPDQGQFSLSRRMQGRIDVYEDLMADEEEMQRSIALINALKHSPGMPGFSGGGAALNENLMKVRDFDSSYYDDFYLSGDQLSTLVEVYTRMNSVQKFAGHGNFNILGYDAMLSLANKHPEIGPFTQKETDFVDMVFHEEAGRYGFQGEKLISKLTDSIPDRSLYKVRDSGQHLFKGHSMNLFRRIKSDIGSSIVLTSGVRGVPKQIHLFFGKTILAKGNLSRASRSLAPPGHSYHGIGDFDVGKLGYGMKNFTSDFTKTREFKKLSQLGYVKIRYAEDNLLGVRYEPWHVKVV